MESRTVFVFFFFLIKCLKLKFNDRTTTKVVTIKILRPLLTDGESNYF